MIRRGKFLIKKQDFSKKSHLRAGFKEDATDEQVRFEEFKRMFIKYYKLYITKKFGLSNEDVNIINKILTQEEISELYEAIRETEFEDDIITAISKSNKISNKIKNKIIFNMDLIK